MQESAAASATGDRTPTCVLVLGMHRSGTSALTRVLNLLGVALGERLMQAVDGNNETGFWEHQGVVDTHEALLATFGMRWHDPRRLPRGWTATPAADTARAEIRSIIDGEFADRPLWGVKDPRMCRLLPLWLPLLAEQGIRPVVVHMVRQPLEIARSLERRDALPRGQGLLLWLRHQIEAIRASQGLPQAWVSYDALVTDWRSAVRPIGRQIDVELDIGDTEAATEIDRFLVPTLRHHVLDAEAIERDPDLAAWVGAIYTAVGAAATGKPAGLLAVADRVEAEIDRASVYFDQAYEQASRVELTLGAEIAERDARIAERDSRIAERDNRIAERDSRITERDARIADRDARIAERDAQIAGRDAQMAGQERHIRALNQAVEHFRAELTKAEQRHGSEIAELTLELNDRRREIAALLSSTSWKLSAPVRRLGRPIKRLLRAGAPMRLHPRAMHDLRRTAFGWATAGTDPSLALDPPRPGTLPTGPVRLRYTLDIENHAWGEPQLYFGIGGDFAEERSLRLPTTNSGHTEVTVEIPAGTTDLRFDPPDGADQLRLRDVSVQPLAGPAADWRAMLGWLRAVARRQTPLGRAARNLAVLWSPPARETARARRRGEVWTGPRDDYPSWAAAYDTLTPQDRAAIRARIERLGDAPTISVVMPVYDPPPAFLEEAIESVTRQLYPNWELCIADDCSTDPEVSRILERRSQADARIKVIRRDRNGHISQASNSALALATGAYVALLDHDDVLAEHALYMVAETIAAHPDVDVIYSDEDKLDARGQRCAPYFKPDFNPDLFHSQNFVNHLGVYRRKLVEAAGGFREGFEGSQDYDLALRVIERSAVERVRHIPHVLYHWRVLEGSVALAADQKSYAHDRALRALAEHFERRHVAATVEEAPAGRYRRVRYPVPVPAPRVSVIIPTRDRVELLRTAIGSLLEKTDYPDIEVLIVDNGSTEDATLEYFQQLTAADPRVRVVPDDGPFNYSRLNNRAAAEATGAVLCLLNNDTEVMHADWLSEMVGHAMRPEVGAVGAKLYYADGGVQHAGVVLGIGGIAGHVFIGLRPGQPGYFSREALTQSYSAVTAACLVTRREIFEQLGGLDEANLGVAFNDVDYCLRVWESGHSVVWTPFAELYHHESASRGSDEDPTKRARFRKEIRYMRERWGVRIAADPFYNPNLSLAHDDFRPAVPPRASKPWLKR